MGRVRPTRVARSEPREGQIRVRRTAGKLLDEGVRTVSSGQFDGTLIAETSETGEAARVWVLETGERVPRQFRRHDIGLPLERFNSAGATREETASWLGATAFAQRPEPKPQSERDGNGRPSDMRASANARRRAGSLFSR